MSKTLNTALYLIKCIILCRMNTNQFIAMNRLLSAQFSLILCSNETHKPKWRGESLLTLSFYAVSTNIEILLVEILFYLGRIWFLKINKVCGWSGQPGNCHQTRSQVDGELRKHATGLGWVSPFSSSILLDFYSRRQIQNLNFCSSFSLSAYFRALIINSTEYFFRGRMADTHSPHC